MQRILFLFLLSPCFMGCSGSSNNENKSSQQELRPGAVETVQCKQLPAVAEGVCQVEGAGRSLLIQGIILAENAIYQGGELAVASDGRIQCVGCDCATALAEELEVTKIICPRGAVSPGLINAHDHLRWTHKYPANWGDERFDHRHDWRKGKREHQAVFPGSSGKPAHIRWGELRNILAGTTSIAGSGGEQGLLRNVDRESVNDASKEKPGGNDVYYQTFPLGDRDDGTLEYGTCGYSWKDGVKSLDNSCYLPHVAEGIDLESRNEFLCMSSNAAGGLDLAQHNSAFIHAVGVNAKDGAELAHSGTSVIWSPRSNVSLYGNTAPVTMLAAQGVNVGLGTDWTISGSMNMLRELQCVDYLNRNHYSGFFTDHDLWRIATANNAKALQVDTVLGGLAQNKVADIAIFDASERIHTPFSAVVHAQPNQVSLVLRGGKPLYGDATIVTKLGSWATDCDAIGGVCGTDKIVCLADEIGTTFENLAAENTNSYPLFFCEEPESEPSCKPARTRQVDEERPYNGPTEGDQDGDGVADGSDNCVRVFNPIRPMDNGVQSDVDGDAIGDVCDACPMTADSARCATYAPENRDADSDQVIDTADNCPFLPNADQQNQDQDHLGDTCDSCPTESSDAFDGCPTLHGATIYELKRFRYDEAAKVRPGRKVETSGVVTATNDKGFVLQTPEKDHDPVHQYNFSGIFVYAGSAADTTMPARGQYVTVLGTLSDFYGQLQLNELRSVSVHAETQISEPTPVPIDSPLSIATKGEGSEELEGVLVKIENVKVTDTTLEETEDKKEFAVTDGLRIGSSFYVYDDKPKKGTPFRHVIGPLLFRRNNFKIQPRDADDYGLDRCLEAECGHWGTCDTETGQCIAQEGFCATSDDCKDAEKRRCDEESHTCMPGNPCDSLTCGEWQSCSPEEGTCEANEGFCNGHSDCAAETPICDPQEHTCKATELLNGDFEVWEEDKPQAWKRWPKRTGGPLPKVTLSRVDRSSPPEQSDPIFAGQHALRAVFRGKKTKPDIRQSVKVQPGVQYRLSAHFKGATTLVQARLYADGKFQSWKADHLTNCKDQVNWQQLTYIFKPETENIEVGFRLYSCSGLCKCDGSEADSEQTMFIDDVLLTPYEDTE